MHPAVLAVLTRAETAGAALETARLAAQRMGGARMEPLHVRHDPMEGFLPTEEVMTPERRHALAAAEAKNSALVKAAFEDWLGSQPQPGPSWREVIGTVQEVVAEQARHAGLVVVGHPSNGRNPDASAAIHALLFETRVPILLAPPIAPVSVGRHAALAWKRSQPAERALEAALPLLLKADRATILIGDDESEEESFPSAAARSLRGAGIPLDITHFASGERGIGEALLAEAHACGADMLVMGAFAHSRIREFVLGGATRAILHHADLPVLMRH